MRSPYLIQRAKFANNPEKMGIDQLLRFDYMGSAEFEFGALPKSLKRIRENIDSYTQYEYSFKDYPNKTVTVFCKKENLQEYDDILENLVKNCYRLKEYCDLKDFVKDTHYIKYTNDFWWDIENDWCFWKSNAEFSENFQIAIKN